MNIADQHLSQTVPAVAVPANLKPYSRPQIMHELELETRAGSPRGPRLDPTNPLGLPKQ